jgi:hypothetical protein
VISSVPRRALRATVLGGSLLAAAALLASPPASAQHSAGSSPAAAGFPTYIKGTVVNSSTGAQVSGVLVTVRSPSLALIASDTTNANGVFRMDGLHSDEYALKFNGSRRGYETGYGGCFHGVVPTFGEACTFAPGAVGRFRLDRL